MQFKRGPSSSEMMRIVLSVTTAVYVTIPVYLAAVLLYRRGVKVGDDIAVAFVLAGLLVCLTAYDYRRTHRRRAAMTVSFTLLQLLIGIATVTFVNLGAGGAPGTYRILYLLPLVVVAVMGDLAMIATVWAVSLACLDYVVFRQTGHQVDTTLWTMVIDGSAWGAAAVAIHLATQRFLAGTATADAVAELAGVADQVEQWPEGLAPCLPLVARALDADRVFLFAGPPGAALQAVAVHPQGAGVHPALSTGAARALDGDRIVDTGELVFIPRRTASGLDVVIVTRTATSHHVRPEIAVTVSRLIVGIVDRASLIGSLRELAMTDPLTGLPNRRSMFESLDRLVAIAARSAEPFSVAMIDLDHFKDYNDQFGHQAGDQILRDLGTAFRSGIRHQDLVARYGGEEFCVLMPGTTAGGAATLLDHLRRQRLDGNAAAVSFSAGIAQWDGHETPDELLSRADTALYRAKEHGRDRVETAA